VNEAATILLDRRTIWLLKRRYGKRLGVKQLVRRAVAEAARDQAQKVLNTEGYAPVGFDSIALEDAADEEVEG